MFEYVGTLKVNQQAVAWMAIKGKRGRRLIAAAKR
jgi:hypothetical protein